MSTHRLFLVAAAIAATSLLAGCGGSDDSGGPAAAAPPTDGAVQSAPVLVPSAATADACTLLTNDEVAKLFPQPTSKPVSASQPGQSVCRWEGGADPSNVPPDLVLDVRAMPKDFPLDQAKGSLAAEGKEAGNQVITDLGDVGIVKSAIDGIATVTWIQGPYLVSLDLSAKGAETQHDAVVAAAHAASGRLG
jgi:hypothetical protein